VPAICLGRWSLNATLFDGLYAAGPVATLFSEDVEAMKEALNTNLQRTFGDFQKLARVFYMPEILDLDEATQLIKKPR
jgi:hypothetical protein